MRHVNPSRQPAVELESVTRHYGKGQSKVVAVHGIDLEIEAGSVTSILGPNGAGKTTTIKLMLGLLRPTAGRIALLGRDPRSAEARRSVGVMMQVAGLPDTLRVEELVRLFSSYYPEPLALERVLDLAGLWELRSRRFGQLSGGQRQRVLFALAIVGNPDILFLDEPTVGLDIETRHRFWQQIRTLIQRGKTIVLTTHYLEEADALSDRIVLIDQGVVRADGTPHQIKSSTSSRQVSCLTRVRPEDIAEHPAVLDARLNRARLEVATTDGEEIVRHLFALDPELRELEVRGAGIDEAFLHLTADASVPAPPLQRN